MGSIRRHVSYANVTATLALFVALGGTSYAALTLPRASVGAAQIRSGAVTPSKLSVSLGAKSASFGSTTVSAFVCHDSQVVGSSAGLRQCAATAPAQLGTMTIKLGHPAVVLLLGRAEASPSQSGEVATLSAYADGGFLSSLDPAGAIPLANPPELAVQSMVRLSAGTHTLHLGVSVQGTGTTEFPSSRLMAIVLPPAA
jgi:hypothetical protein